MPALPNLDFFPYVGQEEDSLTCVIDCIDMVCQYLGLAVDRDEVSSELATSIDTGTPFDNVEFVSAVDSQRVGTVGEIEAFIQQGSPVIADLLIHDAKSLGYGASEVFRHAVVVVGIEADAVLFFDPLSLVQRSTTDPHTCDLIRFERAWRGGWVLGPP